MRVAAGLRKFTEMKVNSSLPNSAHELFLKLKASSTIHVHSMQYNPKFNRLTPSTLTMDLGRPKGRLQPFTHTLHG